MSLPADPSFVLPAPTSNDDGVACWQGLPIRRIGDWQQTLDVYARTGAAVGSAPRPVVMCFHGGGWRTGTPAGYRDLGLHLARAWDVVVVSASYRLVDRAQFPAQPQDAANAVRWIRAHAAAWNIDSQRLAVCGSSAGGYLAAMVALTHDHPQLAGGDAINAQSAAPQALVVCWGPLDFIARWYGNGGKPGAELGLLGRDFVTDPTAYHRASALAYARSDAPPALFVQGRQDPVVHQQQGELGHAAWRRHGVASELLLLEQIGHGVTDPADQALEKLAVERFLAARFKLVARAAASAS
jgi:acetyl esterase/lipase